MPAAVSGDAAEQFVASGARVGAVRNAITHPEIHRLGVVVGIFGIVGMPGIGDMLGGGDMEGMCMLFISSCIDAQQFMCEPMCEPGCAMRRYRPAAMTKMPTAMPVAARAG
jgi:hypothetical protein